MFKLNTLVSAVALALVLPSSAFAEFEISGEAKFEYGLFTHDGTVTGATSSHDSGDAMKTEGSLKLFINSDVGEDSSFHAEVLFSDNGEAASDRLEGGEQDGQYEILREFYFDTSVDDWYFRLGKQQVVWGTADGIKLLDIINPTDFRELNQNTTEDARLPVWMINAETDLDNGGNIQIIVSEAKANFISGLDKDGDSGAPFVFKGVDTITGKSGGFLNIAPALGRTAGVFQNFSPFSPVIGFVLGQAGPAAGITNVNEAITALDSAAFGGNDNMAFGAGDAQFNANAKLEDIGGGTFTVLDFVEGRSPFCFGGDPKVADDLAVVAFQSQSGALGATCAEMLNNITQGFAQNNGETNLVESTYDSSKPDNAFEYMADATYATFDTFAGISTDYRQDHPDNKANLGIRYKNSTESGVNYSLNYLYAYDSNPVVNISWEDSAGNTLIAKETTTAANPGQNGIVDGANADFSDGEFAAGTKVGLFNKDGTQYAGTPATLVFTETLERVTNLGGSFDMAVDSFSVPVVLRGELLLQLDVNVPVVDRNKLAIGDLVGALKSEETDMLKYVFGVDITVMTNLLVSTQLIQMINLDYVDNNKDAAGNACNGKANCGRYTGDPSSLSLTNGLNKGDEIETFVSIFLSKPFGDDFEHRWNNILIAENGGGYWNRFDVEIGISDEMVGTFELNRYWGDEDTTFGQFDKSSNIQVGLKYLF